MISYLHSLFKDRKSYSVINTHKAMLLQTLMILGNKWCSSQVLISRFMKGVFVKKPPVPKYRFTWDVSVVLKLLSSWFPLKKLNLKFLSMKLIALIALATTPRAQTLMCLDLNYMKTYDSYVMFYFPQLLKTSVTGKSNSYSLKLEHFSDESLCVYHTLKFYIKVTRSLRKSSQLFISYVTYNAVTSSTLARWLRSVLDLAGIDVSIFKAHSFRSASTSAAFQGNCSVKNIISTAGWKSDQNFFMFYQRTVVRKEDVDFMTAVFKT